MADVFISYNREDRETARLVASGLEAEGFSVWWDAALRAGEYYEEVTESNLRSAGAVVVLWSKRSAGSKWVRAEATVGERSSTLVPALIEECDRPVRFELVQTADLTRWRGDRNDPNWRAFMQDVRTAISRRGSKPAPVASTSAPAASQDASIETAFWNSIKDASDSSDFEAYLDRYPNGHFAALARNRLAALAKPAARPAPPPQQRPSTQQHAPQQQAPRQARPQAAAPRPQQQPAQRAAAAPPPEKKSAGGLIFGGIAVALVAVGAVAFMLMRGGEGAEKAATASVAEAPAETAPAETTLAEAASVETTEEFVDVFAEEDAGPANDSIDAIDIAGDPTSTLVEEPLVEPVAEPVVETAPAPAAPVRAKQAVPGKSFRDCETCPLMAPLPGGVFTMGSPSTEPGRNAYEGPQREVTVKPFAISVYEITNAEWNACASEGPCQSKPSGADDALPALSVSWRDATDYASWLSKKTGRKYRLPTEAEWEYAARGGATEAYWWGASFDRARVAASAPSAVGSFAANAFGLYDVLGNAREWVADCYVNNFVNAPLDGSAVTDGDCAKRVIRGGAWSSAPVDMRLANRSRIDLGVRAKYMGVRLAAEVKK